MWLLVSIGWFIVVSWWLILIRIFIIHESHCGY
jgi:hypothetical protein